MTSYNFDKSSYFARTKELRRIIHEAQAEYRVLKERYYKWQIEELSKQIEDMRFKR